MREPNLDVAWDPAKARSDLAKHGVSFAQAATVLLDPMALTVFDSRHSQTEERWFTLGCAGDEKLFGRRAYVQAVSLLSK